LPAEVVLDRVVPRARVHAVGVSGRPDGRGARAAPARVAVSGDESDGLSGDRRVRTAALFADRWILPGLHATLASLLEYSRHSPPFRIVVFGDGLRPHEVELLRATTAPLLGAHTLEVRAFTISLRGRFRSLRGNYT